MWITLAENAASLESNDGFYHKWYSWNRFGLVDCSHWILELYWQKETLNCKERSERASLKLSKAIKGCCETRFLFWFCSHLNLNYCSCCCIRKSTWICLALAGSALKCHLVWWFRIWLWTCNWCTNRRSSPSTLYTVSIRIRTIPLVCKNKNLSIKISIKFWLT